MRIGYQCCFYIAFTRKPYVFPYVFLVKGLFKEVIFIYFMKKVALYYRTSKDSANRERLQKIKCREYCRMNNLSIFKEYSDLNVSGRRRNRVGLNTMLKESDKFSEVIVYNFDRLGRKVSILKNVSDLLKSKNVRLSSVTQRVDENTPYGEFIKEVFFLLAEFESSITSYRIKDGKHAKKVVENGG